MFYGLLDIPWWGYPLVLLGLTHITILCVTLFLHRCQAHRALELHPIVSHFFRLWLWLTTGMETKAWAAIHRKHHAKCETKEDPHSPQVVGLETVLFKGTELYRREGSNAETLARYGQGTPDDWLERNIYTPHSRIGVFITLAVDLLLFGVPGLALWSLQMAWIPFFAAGVVNGVGHHTGYRNFECNDASRNVFPLGVIIGGEELHNNHHTFPTSAKFSVKWWEFDSGWLYIKLLSWLGLAKVKRVPPKPQLNPSKNYVDIETVKAVITNRFQIMAHYSQSVIAPVFKQEKQKASQQELPIWQQRMQKLLVREPTLLDKSAKQRLGELISKSNSIKVVYHFKEQLQSIWLQTTLKDSDLLDSLQKWCQEAEATGNKCLQDFARYLRSFSLQAV